MCSNLYPRPKPQSYRSKSDDQKRKIRAIEQRLSVIVDMCLHPCNLVVGRAFHDGDRERLAAQVRLAA